MSAGPALKLSQMVDLALGSPEVGAVNFNVLHTLLHAMLSKLNVADVMAEIDEDDHRALTQKHPGSARSMTKVHFQDDKESVVTVDSGVESVTGQPQQGPIVPKSSSSYHALQNRMNSVERQLDTLNALPKNKDLIDQLLGTTTDKRAVSDMWQMVNLKRRVDGTEEGMNRLASLVDDLMREMMGLKDENEQLKKRLTALSDMSSYVDRMNRMEQDIKGLNELLKSMTLQLSLFPSPDMFKTYVTWDGLEKLLKGIREEMDKLKVPTEKVVINMATDTADKSPELSEANSVEPSPSILSEQSPSLVLEASPSLVLEASIELPMSRPQSASSKSSGPSEALMEMLESLGKLSERHDSLEVRVDALETEMPNKADKKDLEGFNSIPDDLLQRIADMAKQIEQLMGLRNRDVGSFVPDHEAMTRIREALSHLQNEMDKLQKILDGIAGENKDVVQRIQELFNITTDHEGRKADLTYVDEKLEPKAEKKMVDGKVNFTLFDETTGNLHKLIDDLLRKLLSSEEELRKLLSELTGELDGKLDRLELDPLKEWLEKRLKALAAKIKAGGHMDMTDDEAAGLRKQLLQHFHCISCDRPIDMGPQPPPQFIPEKPAMSPSKSLRPYTTYELEAIRQHARRFGRNDSLYISPQRKCLGGEVIDVYYTPRSCGGSHTTTFPTKRSAKMTNTNNAFPEEENQGQVTKSYREELDLQGVDGHIYKGRVDRLYTSQPQDDGKLPPVPNQQGTTRSQAPGGAGGFVKSATTIDRPRSGRPTTPRAAPARRPVSARAKDSRPTTPGMSDGIGPAPTPSLEVPQPGIDDDNIGQSA